MRIIILIIFLIPIFALADDVVCPVGATLKGETTPDSREAWCEIMHEGKMVMHGPYKTWWSNGNLASVGTYKYGKMVGKWEGWFEGGRYKGSETYDDNGVLIASDVREKDKSK